MRNVVDMVSESFIWGVGITRPKPGQERRAALYITWTLVGAIVVALGAFVLIASLLRAR
jgi:hypothetical protein